MGLQYFSKWREKFVEFKTFPSKGEIMALDKFGYKFAIDGKEIDKNEILKDYE